MTDDKINYDALMQKAHRGVIQEVLLDVEQNGLPAEHHFFIIFDTTHGGARISDRLRAQYPREMTIVMQYQYSNLCVHDDYFEIQLSFSRIPELLVIPFEAITGFVDPSVPFGLQLTGDPAASLENSIGMLVPGLAQIDRETENRMPLPADILTHSEREADNLWEGENDPVPGATTPHVGLREVEPVKKPFNPFLEVEPAKLVTDNREAQEDEDEAKEAVPNANIVQLDAFRKKS
jgi:hypothetical protein